MTDRKCIAVGDVHGCPRQLSEILAAARRWPDHRLVFLGDYIDRGPDGETVIRMLRRLDAVCIMGNHEDMLLNRLDSLPPENRAEFLAAKGLSQESVAWIRRLPLWHETADCLFIHGGLDTDKAIAEQTRQDLLWTRCNSDYSHLTGKLVIHGHTPVDAMERVGNRINLNTGCGAGGPLSALVLPEMVGLRSSASPGLDRRAALLREMRELHAGLGFGELRDEDVVTVEP
jgi:serine/threonine protein phosphatase 1